MKLSIVIPAYNEEKYLPRCLDSLQHHVTGDDRLLEVIVVDNASTDQTAQVASQYPFAKVVAEPRKGLPWARQKGLLSAQGDLLAYIDADTEVSDGWLGAIYEHFTDNHELVCLSGPAYYFDLDPWQDKITHFYWHYLARPAYKMMGYMVTAANFTVKRETLERIGGFDPTVSFYGDDTNLARRLSEAGKVLFDNNFRVYTSGRRLKAQGTIKTGAIYAASYVSEALFKRPIVKHYDDIR